VKNDCWRGSHGARGGNLKLGYSFLHHLLQRKIAQASLRAIVRKSQSNSAQLQQKSGARA
jgi:hypothetical protein